MLRLLSQEQLTSLLRNINGDKDMVCTEHRLQNERGSQISTSQLVNIAPFSFIGDRTLADEAVGQGGRDVGAQELRREKGVQVLEGRAASAARSHGAVQVGDAGLAGLL